MSHPHWDYFLSIESDLIRCSRFVEFDQANYATYSVEFARIIVAASAEFDAVAKALCAALDPTTSPQSITAYRPIITAKYPRFVDYTIHAPRFKQQFQPWSGWTPVASPDWWSKGYNKIKHERDRNFSSANLQNALLSTTGLLVGIAYLYDALYGSVPEIDFGAKPQLFEPQDDPAGFEHINLQWSCKVWK